SEFTSSTEVTSDITVTAEYTPITYTVTYVLGADESITLATQQVEYGNEPEEVTLQTVVSDSDGNQYYLYKWTQPTDVIIGDTTIPVAYQPYDSVYELKITDCGDEIVHTLAMKDETITLPDSGDVTPLDGYTFMGWGVVYSGGYADPGVKKECTAYEDTTDNYLTNTYAGIDPGGEVTLSDSNRMSGTYDYASGDYIYDNYKFVAVYNENYTVNYYINGELDSTETVTWGTNITIREAPVNNNGVTGEWQYDGSTITDSYYVESNMDIEAYFGDSSG
ncbi:MAG: hypothetical protein ACI4J5_02305, partial [Oscillospiraceae bacterium]